MSSFRAEVRRLVGHMITVATECGSITGRLVKVGSDKIVIRTTTARFIIRIRKICWVRRVGGGGGNHHHHHRSQCWEQRPSFEW